MPSDELPRKLTGETGSLRYMAPEVALYWPYTHRSEVFSFALVLWEVTRPGPSPTARPLPPSSRRSPPLPHLCLIRAPWWVDVCSREAVQLVHE